MKFIKTIAITATLLAGVSAASASTLNSELNSFGDITSAQAATVLTVNDTEARLLRYDNDVAAIQARVQANPALLDTIQRQGFSVENIVGASGDQNSLTLFAI